MPAEQGSQGGIRETRRRLQHAFEEIAQFGTWQRFLDTDVVTWSPGVREVLGLPADEPADLATFRSMIHPDDVASYRRGIRRLEEEGRAFSLEVRIVRPDGETRLLHVLGHRVEDIDDGRRLLGVVQDITDQRRLEADRARLLATLLRVADDERRRLAGRIHDDVIQELSVALMRTQTFASDLSEEEIEQICDPIITAVETLRAILADLAPPDVAADELRASIADYADRVLDAETTLDITVDDAGAASQTTLSTALRIIREALSNAARHARADHIDIDITTDVDCLTASVFDDGVGFRPSEQATDSGHLGMTLMRDRTRDLDGRLEIISTPGEGTTVSAQLPLEPVPAG